ncbi:MAG TPA: STT3 domain-containing protein, partial [Methanolinea sp.]|nr:STT3 domain-containing protein [Methanolinea sp.]
MVFKNFRVTKTRVFIIGLLFILSLITLWIRVIPLLNLNTDILNIVASDDPMFSLRQIEQMMAHYPSYAWFDAMTLYPFGKDIPWGPLFTLIATTFVMIFGASTRSEIISVALWVPPLMAAVTVPVMYLLGKKLADWKTGLCAAILITAVGGQYFYRSLAGYLDHHIAEVLFSTLFCFTYIFALVYLRDHPVDFNVKSTWKTPIVLSTVAGVAYILGYLTMSTMILFAFITALFTLIIFILDFYHGRPSQYIVLLNTLVFGIAAVFSLLVSFISGGIDAGLGFYLYTLIHPIAYLLLVIGTWLLFWLGHYLEGKNRVMYPLSIIGIGFIAILSVFLFLPALYGSFVNGIEVFFGFNPFAATVQEARVWSIEEAWEVFNFGLILMIGGVLVLIYRDWKQYHGEHVYVLVWTLFIVIAAFRQVRYEYYLAVNIALLGAICIGFFINLAEPEIRLLSSLFKSQGQSKLFKDEKRNLKKSLKPEKKPSSDKKPNYIKIMSFGLICACAVLYIGGSVQYELRVAGSGALRMNPDWR